MSEALPTTALHAAVQTVLALAERAEPEALEAALAAADSVVAARAVAAAPTLGHKTTVLWAMEDRQRREVLEYLPPALIGALIQNLEEDNCYLLGDLSLHQFRNLLSLCSPERKYYWLITALSFPDARANALPFLLPTTDLVDILLTRHEFTQQIRTIAEFPIEDQRVPEDLLLDPAQAIVDLFGPEQLLKQFPVADPNLEHLLQILLDLDPDRFTDLLRLGLARLDYEENHPLEWEALTEDPVLVSSLEPVQPLQLSGEPQEVLARLVEDAGGMEETTPPALALVPVHAAPLVRLTGSLPAPIRARIGEELQQLYIRQAIAEGGSFLREDLERVARTVEAYLLLGIQAESDGRADTEPLVLALRPLQKVSQSGARLVENLRQVAMRLQPLQPYLSSRDRAVVRSLQHPRLTVSAEGEPRLQLWPGPSLPEHATLPEVAVLLREAAAWTSLARALGLEDTGAALERLKNQPVAGDPTEKLQEELALCAVLYHRLEYGLVTSADRERFERQYVDPDTAEPTPAARSGARHTLERWGEARKLDVADAAPLFEAALHRLAHAALH